MGDRTKDELVKDFDKLVKGVERDVQSYEKKIATIAQSQANYEKLVSDTKAAIADKDNLTADKVSELSALAGTLKAELVAAHDYVTQKTKTGSNKSILANTPGWITEDVSKAKTSISKILSELRKLTPQEQADAKRAMIESMYDKDTLTSSPELYDKDIKDVWGEYADGVAARLKKVKDVPGALISHPETLDKQGKDADAWLVKLAAAYDLAEKIRQAKEAKAPGVLKSIVGPPRPRIMYHGGIR